MDGLGARVDNVGVYDGHCIVGNSVGMKVGFSGRSTRIRRLI